MMMTKIPRSLMLRQDEFLEAADSGDARPRFAAIRAFSVCTQAK
jgi:hypothetical protein